MVRRAHRRECPFRMIRVPLLKPAFALAWPASLAAMITPLLGIIDTAVLSRAAGTADIAGVALASAVFSVLYWTLGFLRMSVAGFTAQADGRADEPLVRAHLLQGVVVGGLIGLILVIIRIPIADLSVSVMAADSETSPDAMAAMHTYIDIRLWAAPLAIAFFAGIGMADRPRPDGPHDGGVHRHHRAQCGARHLLCAVSRYGRGGDRPGHRTGRGDRRAVARAGHSLDPPSAGRAPPRLGAAAMARELARDLEPQCQYLLPYPVSFPGIRVVTRAGGRFET